MINRLENYLNKIISMNKKSPIKTIKPNKTKSKISNLITNKHLIIDSNQVRKSLKNKSSCSKTNSIIEPKIARSKLLSTIINKIIILNLKIILQQATTRIQIIRIILEITNKIEIISTKNSKMMRNFRELKFNSEICSKNVI